MLLGGVVREHANDDVVTLCESHILVTVVSPTTYSVPPMVVAAFSTLGPETEFITLMLEEIPVAPLNAGA